jgi:hypothetical protein
MEESMSTMGVKNVPAGLGLGLSHLPRFGCGSMEESMSTMGVKNVPAGLGLGLGLSHLPRFGCGSMEESISTMGVKNVPAGCCPRRLSRELLVSSSRVILFII